MLRPSKRFLLAAALVATVGCSGPARSDDASTPTTDGSNDAASRPCDERDDTDGDGRINSEDDDADGDGIPDRVEAQPRGAGAMCVYATLDSDSDGAPDYVDRDSNADGVPDAMQVEPSPAQGMQTVPPGGWGNEPYDSDRDGTPDYADLDGDGDGIRNGEEMTDGNAVDTDRDGLPDWRDVDSDGDTVADRDEGIQDRDGDRTPNFRDDDSDGDGLPDRQEAGDTDVTTRPVECATELDSTTLRTARMDGTPDFLDNDSDNDGLSDREETAAGTRLCDPDSDDDGQLDIAEVAYCARRMRMGCATDAMSRIPDTDYYIILPVGARETRVLDFGTSIRVADVFFISDTTGSMNTVLQSVRSSIATPRTGIVDRVRAEIPDAWFGVGHYEDYPRSPHAVSSDRVFHPLCPGLPGSAPGVACSTGRYGGIMINRNAMDVQTAANAIPAGSGGDGLSTSVEALYQLVVGDGLYDRSSPTPCLDGNGTNNCWVPRTECPEGYFGAACFRRGALPIVVHYSDTQSHWGARTTAGSFNRPVTGLSPMGHTSDDMIMAYRRVGGRMISLNALTSSRCDGRVLTTHDASSPCYDFRIWAEGTGSVNIDGQPFIFDIVPGNAESFISATVDGIRQIATRTAIDVSTGLENDPMNPMGFDARSFITRRVPTCETTTPRNTMCWTAAAGTPHNTAVARTDTSTFYRVLPGTRVRFTVTFDNANAFPGYPDRSALFHAYIHVLADGVSRLDTREVFILVPARPSEPG